MKLPSFTRPVRSDHARLCMAEIRSILDALQRAGNYWAHEVMQKVSLGERVTPYAYELAKRSLERKTPREAGDDDE